MGLFDFLKKDSTNPMEEVDSEEYFERDLHFDDSSKLRAMALLQMDYSETGDISGEALKEARETLDQEELSRVLFHIQARSDEGISSFQALNEKGNVGTHYVNVINAIKEFERFMTIEKLPNICGHKENKQELLVSFSLMNEVYEKIINEAMLYKKHRRFRFNIGQMNERMNYIDQLLEASYKDKKKLGRFVDFYLMNPEFIMEQLGYTEENRTTIKNISWIEVLYAVRTDKISEDVRAKSKLGSGLTNVVYEVESEGGNGAIRLEDTLLNDEMGANLTDEDKEKIKSERRGRMRNQRDKSIAMSRISSLLGSSIITGTRSQKMERKGSTIGVEFMEKAEGKTFEKLYDAEEFDENTVDPVTLKQLSQLHLIDALTFQTDRHMNNIKFMDNGDIRGIDNDAAFDEEEFNPLEGTELGHEKHLPPMGTYVDAEMAGKIRMLPAEILTYMVIDLLSPGEIIALKGRLIALQDYLSSSKVTLVDDWSEVNLEALKSNDDNYLYRLLWGVNNRKSME